MTSPTGSGQRRGSRQRTFGVAPYVPGRTTKEYVADGTLHAVEADDEAAAIAAYAVALGLTITGDPVMSKSGKRLSATLSDGREYVVRSLKAAIAELLPPELLIEAAAAPPPGSAVDGVEPGPSDATAPAQPWRRDASRSAREGAGASADGPPGPTEATPAPPDAEPASPPEISPPAPVEPPEFVEPDAVSAADLDRLRPTLQPRSWDMAAALWGAAGHEPESIQAVAARFSVTPAFVRMVAASVVHLAADGGRS